MEITNEEFDKRVNRYYNALLKNTVEYYNNRPEERVRFYNMIDRNLEAYNTTSNVRYGREIL